jgi:hypothetical protein
MSIDMEFKQISFHLLEKLKENPFAINVFIYAEYSERVTQENDLQELSDEYANFSREDLDEEEDDRRQFWKWILDNLEKHPEQYRRIKEEIPKIIAEGKTAITLEIYGGWRIIHFLLTRESSLTALPFLVDENSQGEDFTRVNAVMGGTETLCDSTYNYVRYLTPDEVNKIAKALSKISEENLRQRAIKSGILKSGTDKDFDYILKEYNLIVEFYKDAVKKENAMLLYLT